MNASVEQAYAAFPKHVKPVALALRELVLNAAKNEKIDNLEEALKWGQPSFLSPIGSTIRIGTASKKPNDICLFFICTTSLVDTFRELFGEQLNYEGNRAIVLPLSEPLPTLQLNQAIALALTYQRVKHLPLLGQ